MQQIPGFQVLFICIICLKLIVRIDIEDNIYSTITCDKVQVKSLFLGCVVKFKFTLVIRKAKPNYFKPFFNFLKLILTFQTDLMFQHILIDRVLVYKLFFWSAGFFLSEFERNMILFRMMNDTAQEYSFISTSYSFKVH